MEGVKKSQSKCISIIIGEQIQIIPNNCDSFYYSGIGEDGKKYMMIKINSEKTDPSHLTDYLLELEGKSHTNLVKYCGLYYSSQDKGHYLTFEMPTSNFLHLIKVRMNKMPPKEKYHLLNEILSLMKYFQENKIVYPLMTNLNFYFIDEIGDNSALLSFKLLFLGKVISIEDQYNKVIDLPDLKEIYRQHFIEQAAIFENYFDYMLVRVNPDNSQDQIKNINAINNSEQGLDSVGNSDIIYIYLAKYYLFIFCKLIILLLSNNISNIQISDIIDFNQVKNLPNDLNMVIKNFLIMYLNIHLKDRTIGVKSMETASLIFRNYTKISYPSGPEVCNNFKQTLKVIHKPFIEENNFISSKRKRENSVPNTQFIDLTGEEEAQLSSENEISIVYMTRGQRNSNQISQNKGKSVTFLNYEKKASSIIGLNSSMVEDEKKLFIEKRTWMKNNFPLLTGDPPTYYNKNFDDYYFENAILPADLPEVNSRKSNDKENNLPINRNITPTSNYNININMTNFIINNDYRNVNYLSQSNFFYNFKDNIINSLTSSINYEPVHIWSGSKLPQSEGEHKI